MGTHASSIEGGFFPLIVWPVELRAAAKCRLTLGAEKLITCFECWNILQRPFGNKFISISKSQIFFSDSEVKMLIRFMESPYFMAMVFVYTILHLFS